MDTDTDDGSKSLIKQPSPADFDMFLTWACTMLNAQKPPVISKIVQNDYVSVVGVTNAKSKKTKGKISKVDLPPTQEKSFTMPKGVFSDLEPGIFILAYYDASENLVKLHFDRNRFLTPEIFKIIGLIIQFQKYMHTISINRGLNKGCVYEISKFLPFSRITELCLDHSLIEEANYHLLLEKGCLLKRLSLARCSINDAVVENIAANLAYPSSASKSLSILNLASNRITDLGAKYLSEILRSNRQLSYLNLSDNMLTDDGAGHLLDTLLQFPLTFSELLASRSRHMKYLKEKNDMVIRLVKELRAGDFEKRAAKKKSIITSRSVATPKKKGLDKDISQKSLPESKSIPNVDVIFIDKATTMAECALGEFKDPFDKNNTLITDDGVVYSKGNNSLAYINLAYNDLSYVTVKKLLKVLLYQKKLGRKPCGLINVSIEGNFMPKVCRELTMIDDLLDVGLMVHSKRYSSTTPKKRILSKVASAGR